MKHTPGPWHVNTHPVAAPEIVSERRRVAMILYESGSEDSQVDANANLIAAAPELFDSCDPFSLRELANVLDQNGLASWAGWVRCKAHKESEAMFKAQGETDAICHHCGCETVCQEDSTVTCMICGYTREL